MSSSATATASTQVAQPRLTNATGRLPPQTLLNGHYLILGNIGQGGMAAVYQATDLRNNMVVAIKEMSQDGLSPAELREALENFRFEADMLSKLHHANLPRVFEFFSEQARHYLVMEYIDGQTLEQRQQALGGKPLPERDVLGWARQLCDVLTYLHTRRPPIIFRDLKPSNIMVTRGGQIKLIDFGIARFFSVNRSRDTQVLGTPGFAPPEQYGKAQTDERADIYALGCTLYQLLTGYDPATTPFNLPPLRSRSPWVSAQVQQAIERATRLDRDARYRTVDAFARDFFAGSETSRGRAPRTTLHHPAATMPQPATSAAQVASATMAAIVVVHPHDVVFGKLVAGQHGVVAITISGQNGAQVHGQVIPCSPWLRVDHQRFDGPTTVVRVTAETGKIPQLGPQRSALQISCDSQQLFVPVEVEVLPAPAAVAPAAKPQGKKRFPWSNKNAGAKTATTQQRAAARPSKKHGLPAPTRNRAVRFAMSLALGFGFALWFLETLLHVQRVQAAQIPLSAPVALALLLLTTGVAVVGALAGSGGRGWPGRRLTTALGAVVGLVALLSVEGQWLIMSGLDALTHPIVIPGVIPWLAPLLASVGAALGADPHYSRWSLGVLGFVSRHMPIVTWVAAIALGAWAGYVLTQGNPCLSLFGIALGIWLGTLFARSTNRMLRRTAPHMRP